jgi:hypothetical protein
LYTCVLLYKYPVTGICFPEIFGDAEFLTFKYAVEVGDIVEAAFIGYFGNGVGGVYQHARRVAQADLVQAVNKGFTGAFFIKRLKEASGILAILATSASVICML